MLSKRVWFSVYWSNQARHSSLDICLSNSFNNTSHLAKAAFAENLDEVKVLEAPPWDLSILPDCRGRGRGGRRGGGGGRIGGGVLGSLLVE